jgi:hypothetical protein
VGSAVKVHTGAAGGGGGGGGGGGATTFFLGAQAPKRRSIPRTLTRSSTLRRFLPRIMILLGSNPHLSRSRGSFKAFFQFAWSGWLDAQPGVRTNYAIKSKYLSIKLAAMTTM